MPTLRNRLWALVPAAGLVVLGALTFFEWWRVGYLADPKIIAEYHFGSEAMIQHGGEHYRDAPSYASAVLREAAIMAALAVPFIAATVVRSRELTYAAWALLAVFMVVRHAL